MDVKKSVGIWIRVSTEDQAKGESPENHERRARMYADSKEWDVVEVYHLEGISGKAIMEHPEAKRMMQDIKKGKIQALIFSKLARLARNVRELLDFLEYFKVHEADLVSLQESIDTTTPSGRLFYTIIAAMAQWEREEIVDRVTASIPIRAKMGKPIGGHATFGFKWVGKEYMIDETEAPIRKLIYEKFVELRRKKAVAKWLNENGYRARNGYEFSGETISRLLQTPDAKGMRRCFHTTSDGRTKNFILKPESEWVHIPCPAIISTELYDECNRILNDQKKTYKKAGPRPVHLLAGFLHCHCGNKMYIYHSAPTYFCKNCKNKIAEPDINHIYHLQLKDFLLTDMDVAGYMQKTDAEVKEKEEQIAILSNEARKLTNRMKELRAMRMDKELSKEAFMEEHAPLEERMAQIQESLPELQATADFLKIQYLSSDVVLQDARDLYDRWPVLDFVEKRNIVEIITDSITVGAEDISINLSYLPNKQNAGKRAHAL